MPLPEKTSPSIDGPAAKTVAPERKPVPPVSAAEPAVPDVIVEESAPEPVVQIRLSADYQDRGPITMSIAGIPEPLSLEGKQTADLPAMFEESVMFSPAIEIVRSDS